MELSDPKIKKFLIFSQKKDFLIFWERETPQKLFMFMETELSYISGNGTFRVRKKKCFFYFLSPSFKNVLYFRREL